MCVIYWPIYIIAVKTIKGHPKQFFAFFMLEIIRIALDVRLIFFIKGILYEF